MSFIADSIATFERIGQPKTGHAKDIPELFEPPELRMLLLDETV
jgi:hypothetical protein